MGTLQQCCPTYLHICSRNGAIPTEVYNTAGGLPSEYFDVGIPDGSGNTYPRFYYDSREGRCIQFSYLGQGGNFNNFLSQDHCEKFCSRSKFLIELFQKLRFLYSINHYFEIITILKFTDSD